MEQFCRRFVKRDRHGALIFKMPQRATGGRSIMRYVSAAGRYPRKPVPVRSSRMFRPLTMSFRILLVEDDTRLSTLIAGYLRKNDYEVDTVLHGDAAVPAILSTRPDLVILDVNLPGKDGFEICREARKQYDGVIIMVTARDEPFDELLGLEFGADDYVHKPVEPRILLARIKAQLRRVPARSIEGAAAQPERYTFGQFSIDRTDRSVVLPGGGSPDLTSAEFRPAVGAGVPGRGSRQPRRPDAAAARRRIRRPRSHDRRPHLEAAPQAARRRGQPAADQDDPQQGLPVQQACVGLMARRRRCAVGRRIRAAHDSRKPR